jgi:hypothetical protein
MRTVCVKFLWPLSWRINRLSWYRGRANGLKLLRRRTLVFAMVYRSEASRTRDSERLFALVIRTVRGWSQAQAAARHDLANTAAGFGLLRIRIRPVPGVPASTPM